MIHNLGTSQLYQWDLALENDIDSFDSSMRLIEEEVFRIYFTNT